MMNEAVAGIETIAGALHAAARRLSAAGIDGAERDARVLLRHCLGLDMAALIAAERDRIDPAKAAAFDRMIRRRETREPVARIIGSRAFFGRSFSVTANVLDPRPETEILVEQVLADYPPGAGEMRFCDIGTGSGAIALTILAERPRFRAVGVDISTDALACARENADALGLSERFDTLAGDMAEPLSGPFDFIVANPPYIETGQLAALEPEVRHFDPEIALDGGADGLAAYRSIFSGTRSKLVDGGMLYVEAGQGQIPAIRAIARDHGWRVRRIARDLGGVERVLVAGR